MIFAQFWWTLLVFNTLGSSSLPIAGGQQYDDQKTSEQLQSFSRAVDEAGLELQDLWSSFGDLPESLDLMKQPRVRRSALNSMLADNAKPPVKGLKAEAKEGRNWQAEADAWYKNLQVQMAKRDAIRKRMTEKQERTMADSVTDEDMRVLGAQADAWYRDWMAQRARNGANQRRAGRKVERSSGQVKGKAIEHDQALKGTETGNAKPKKATEEATVQKHEQTQSFSQAKEEGTAGQDNVKLKHTPQAIGQQGNFQAQSRMKVKAAPEKVDDHLEKLQESRNAPATAGVYHQTKSNKLDHEANYKLSKIEQEASEKMPKLPRFDQCKPKKRRSAGVCDPMEEIKLKTSSRLIAKGFGPLLPSESFQITRRGKLEEWQNRMLDSTLAKNQQYERLKNLELQPENIEAVVDLPPNLDFKEPPYDRIFTLDQQKKPNAFDLDRTKRKQKVEAVKSEPSPSTFSHVNLLKPDQGVSIKQAVAVPLAPEGQVKALEGKEDQNAPQQWMAVNTQLSDINKAAETREHESKDTVQKLKQELHGDSKLHRAALTKPAALRGSDEEPLKTDAKALAPTVNMNPEATSRLRDNQETSRARRLPRRTRRVKRSLEEQHVAARRRAQLLDENHNGNRVSFGVLGNGLLTPDSEELGGPDLLAYNELKGSEHDPLKQLVSMMNERPKPVYHYHAPLPGQPHKANFKGYTNFSQMNDLQKFLQVQQNILQFLFEIFLKNVDLLDPTKFKPKTQVAKNLLREYQALPLFDQLLATDLLAQDLDELLKTAGDTLHHERDVFLYKVLENVIEEQKTTKPPSRFLKFLNVAELLKDDSEQQSWDLFAVE